MTGALMAASAASGFRFLSGTTTVTLGGTTWTRSDLGTDRVRGFSTFSPDGVVLGGGFIAGATFGSRSPTSLNAITIAAAFTNRDNSGTGTIGFYVALTGDQTGPRFTSVAKKNGGSTEETLARTSATVPLGTFDGTYTWWFWVASTEWPTSGSRNAVFV